MKRSATLTGGKIMERSEKTFREKGLLLFVLVSYKNKIKKKKIQHRAKDTFRLT